MNDKRIIALLEDLEENIAADFLFAAYKSDFIRFADNYFSVNETHAKIILRDTIWHLSMYMLCEEYDGTIFDIDKKIFEIGKNKLYVFKNTNHIMIGGQPTIKPPEPENGSKSISL